MKTSLLAAIVLLAPAHARAIAAETAPPVILISVDDLREDRVRPDLMPRLSALLE
ncbi:MAG: hypothetical protein SF051_04340 [Elusimicrobiota bacterium]|nr:hypothetical protein [Elusimicrobiota bacterium]